MAIRRRARRVAKSFNFVALPVHCQYRRGGLSGAIVYFAPERLNVRSYRLVCDVRADRKSVV